jgi:predicted dehydrogenase
MSKLRAGVVGAGAFGRIHARKYSEDARVQFIGVHDPDDERATDLANTHSATSFPTLDALLAAADIITIASPPSFHGAAALAALNAAYIVTIASPPSFHGAAARRALDAGKHVLIEKPLATDTETGAQLVRLAHEKKLVLACGHQERLVFDAMGLLSAPETPTRIESVREGPWTGRSADVSVTLDLMVHDLDLALQLLKTKPQTNSATDKSEHARNDEQIEDRLA